MVDTEGKLVQTLTIAAEVLFEHGQVQSSQVVHRLCSKFRQLLSGNFADARQASNRQRQQEVIFLCAASGFVLGSLSCSAVISDLAHK